MADPAAGNDPMDVPDPEIPPPAAVVERPEADIISVIRGVIPFLTVKDMKLARQTTKLWKRLISEHPCFSRCNKGKISSSWYNDHSAITAELRDYERPNGQGAEEFDFDYTITWAELTLERFRLFAQSEAIKRYWIKTTSLLTKLTLDRSGFNCSELSFLLDFTPFLTTLNLKQVRLRDMDYRLRPHVAPLRRINLGDRDQQEDTPRPPIQARITHLTFENMFHMDSCCLTLLAVRTGHLRSITLKNCFNQTIPIRFRSAPWGFAWPRPTMEQIYNRFVEDFLRILERNRHTLQDISILDNNFQNNLLIRLSEAADEERIATPTKLAITVDANTRAEARRLFVSFMPLVRSLKLDLGVNVSSAETTAILMAVNPELEDLVISVLGGRTSNTDMNLMDPLQRFTRLRTFAVQDRKDISKPNRRNLSFRHNIYPERNARRPAARLAEIVTALTNMNSHFDLLSLQGLPTATLQQLTLDRLINDQIAFNELSVRPQLMALLPGLTKLEIIGPTLQPMGPLLHAVMISSLGLETLIMTACGLTDHDLTGLNARATKQMKLSLTYALGLFSTASDENRNPSYFDQLVDAAPSRWDRQRDMRRRAGLIGGLPPRRRLGDLANLEHVNLAFNHKITDVSVYDAMNLPRLKFLGLHSCRMITDCGMDIITLQCPSIEILNVKNLRKVTQYGLNEIVTRCKNIKTVYSTKTIRAREIAGFNYEISKNYSDIVHISVTKDLELNWDDDIHPDEDMAMEQE